MNRIVLAGTALLLASTAAATQPADSSRAVPADMVAVSGLPPLAALPERDGELRLDFRQVATGTGSAQVVGGEPFDATRLPATFRFEALGCTATLIGPRVLLTAAHCADRRQPAVAALSMQGMRDPRIAGAGGSLRLNDGRPPIAIRCTLAPAYLRSDHQARTVRNFDDYALCELDRAPPVPAETIDQRAAPVAPGQTLMLAGYGCDRRDPASGAILPSPQTIEPVLQVGVNRISGQWDNAVLARGRVPVPGAPVGPDQALICPGDSGGAAFAGVVLASGDDPLVRRLGGDPGWRVVAVNSAVGFTAEQWQRLQRGAREPAGLGVEMQSYLAPLSDPDFRSFLADWIAVDPLVRRVCGVQPTGIPGACRADVAAVP